MPLLRGKKNVGANIHELSTSRTKAGRARNAKPNAHAINVAIAMRKAYDTPKGKRRR
jgi:hypothetical protein